MRQIKFRAQDVASNKWLYGDLRHHKNDVCIFEQGGTKGEQVKRDTIGQFAGLRDINGKDIYEGDIIRQDVCGDGSNGVVVYDEKHAMFALRYYDPHNPIIYGLYDCQEKELKIIGNIYDNPELIAEDMNIQIKED